MFLPARASRSNSDVKIRQGEQALSFATASEKGKNTKDTKAHEVSSNLPIVYLRALGG